MLNTAIILAGGYGKRMYPLSDYVPKPLVKINEKALIDHSIDKLRSLGVDNIYVTYGHKSELLVNHVEKRVNGLINTTNKDNCWFLFNSFIKHVNEYVFVLPCDIIFDIDIESVKKNLQRTRSYIIPVDYSSEIEADNIFVNSDFSISKINRESNVSNLCASGLQICNPYFINNNFAPQDNWFNLWSDLIYYNNLFATQSNVKNWKTYNNLSDITK